ncbi:hypothetical protein B0H19DRAFT_607070 [Mycena capillaripes]|nr:hypothetical protein B0H19DRAFT_607070 [Mycena capillaripes]
MRTLLFVPPGLTWIVLRVATAKAIIHHCRYGAMVLPAILSPTAQHDPERSYLRLAAPLPGRGSGLHQLLEAEVSKLADNIDSGRVIWPKFLFPTTTTQVDFYSLLLGALNERAPRTHFQIFHTITTSRISLAYHIMSNCCNASSAHTVLDPRALRRISIRTT